MRKCELLLAVVVTALPTLLFAQGEVLTPLSARPVPEAIEAMRKAGGLHTYFIYQYDGLELPIYDDFSVDRTRKRWSLPTDPDATLDQTIYQLEVAGVSTPDMVFASDTTFSYMTDTVGVDTTWRTALPEITVLVRDLTVYPPTDEVVQAWPNYNVFDTIQSPSPDTLDLSSADHFQDSLLVYQVAPDPRQYEQPDGTMVPMVLWEDDDVYINGTYPIDPPTIGVATFDGLARTGYPYNFAVYSSYGIADHLTSVGINLDSPLSPADSVYLSFFYQPQGLSGDGNVQSQDSLILEFYAPVEQLWYPAWKTPYVPLQDFEQVMVPITHPRFFHPGFKMRFSNYATLSGSFDHWHLDYVRLDIQRNYSDTLIVDVAYVYPESSLLATYTSVPFSKFDDAPASYMATSLTEQMRNLDNVDKFITFKMWVREENGSGESTFDNGLNTSGNASSIFPTEHPISDAPNSFMYDPVFSTEAAFWRVKFLLQTEPDLIPYNDTTMFIQEISNYMSYDDGSAEMGYGLNIAGGRLAYRFDMVGGDSLRAVRMYFNPQANQPPAPQPPTGSFRITIWSSLDPVSVIHQNLSFSAPEYRLDGVNHFVEYPLDSTIWVAGTFYVGWTQTNNVNMNLGFDRNRNNQNKIFYATTGAFTNTTYAGSLMMRPVFVAAVDPFATIEEPFDSAQGSSQLVLVPNPANDAVIIRYADPNAISRVQFMDATGRLVHEETASTSNSIAIGALQPGIYIVRAVDLNGGTLAQERLIIQR